MKKISNKIVFFGNERIATGVVTTAPTLQALLSAGYNVPAVVCNFEEGQSRNARALEIAEVAKSRDIPLLLPNKLIDIKQQLKNFQAETAVLVAYGKIIPQEIIDIFPKGIINIHPSLLPKHRGPTPIESVILGGSNKTGVSLMSLAKEMDAGPVFGYSELTLDGSETKQYLADTLLDIGSSMLIELLPHILNDSVIAVPQDSAQATYDQLINKAAGLINWDKPASVLEREVRAFSEWPKSYTTLDGMDLIVRKVSVVKTSGPPGSYEVTKKSLVVFCGQNALDITLVQPSGKKEMPIEAFLAGYTL